MFVIFARLTPWQDHGEYARYPFKRVPVNTRMVARVYGLYSLLLVLSSLSLLIGCATSQDIGQVQWQVNELKSEVKNIRQKTHGLDYKQEQKALEEEQKATSKSVSDLLLEVQSLRTEFQILTGRFEEARYSSEKNIKELTESKDELIAQIKELEIIVNSLKEKLDTKKNVKSTDTKQVAGVKKTEEAQKTAGAQKTEEQKKTAPSKDLKDAYMDAYQTYKSNNLKEARKKFQNLLEKYPENEFSDNARFWISETYYREKSYEDAILAYDELLKKNPKSDKVPGALLKQGLAFYELNKNVVARTILEELIEKFPNSKQAQIAKRTITRSAP